MSRRVTCHDTTQRIPAPHPTRWVRARLVGGLHWTGAGRGDGVGTYTYCYSAVDEQSSRLSPDGVTCGAGPVDPRHGSGLDQCVSLAGPAPPVPLRWIMYWTGTDGSPPVRAAALQPAASGSGHGHPPWLF